MAPTKYRSACFELTIPLSVLDSCQQLPEGQQLELEGCSRKKAKFMGSVFKQKLNQFWNCKVDPLPAAEPKSEPEKGRSRRSLASAGRVVRDGTRKLGKSERSDLSHLSEQVKGEVSPSKGEVSPTKGDVSLTKGEVSPTKAGMVEPENEDDLFASEMCVAADNDTVDSGEAIMGLISSALSADTGNVLGTDGTPRLHPCDLTTLKQELESLSGDEVGGYDDSYCGPDGSPVIGEDGTTLIEVLAGTSAAQELQDELQGYATSELPKTERGEEQSKRKREKSVKLKNDKDTKVTKKQKKVPLVDRDVDIGSLLCVFCNRSWFSSHSAYVRHFRVCRKNPDNRLSDDEVKVKSEFVCDVCNMMVPTSGTLTRHRRDVHNIHLQKRKRVPHRYGSRPGGYQCAFCGIKYPHRTSCKNHETYRCTANPDMKHMSFCYLCTHKFPSNAELQEHKAREHADVKFVCDVCGLIFRSRGGLYLHRVKNHDDDKKGNFLCTICERSFYTGKDLTQHLDMHSDERKYTCDECGKSYKYTNHLRRHKSTIHQNKFPYRCLKCGHGVEKRSYLDSHICGRVRRGRSKPPPQMSYFKEAPQQISHFKEAPQQISHFKEAPPQMSCFKEAPPQMSCFKEAPQQVSFKEAPQQMSHFKEAPPQMSYFKEAPQQMSYFKEAPVNQEVPPFTEHAEHAEGTVLHATEIVVGSSQEVVTENGEVYDINVYNLANCDVYQVQE